MHMLESGSWRGAARRGGEEEYSLEKVMNLKTFSHGWLHVERKAP